MSKKENELNQDALDKLMQGAAPGIEAWEEEEEPVKENELNQDALDKLMQGAASGIEAWEEEPVVTEEFEQPVIGGTKDIEDFASGLLSVEPDALDDMEKYIELFGKEFINGSYQFTPAASKAKERIKDLRQKAAQEAEKKHSAGTVFEATQKEINQNKENKNKVAKIKELMKKKPQDRTMQDYLFLKEAIEQNPQRSPEQKAKDIESLTSQARLRMKNPKKVQTSELAVVPAFIAAFGYDKDHAINKDARRFKDAMDKRIAAEKTTDNDFVISLTEEEKKKTKENKKQKKGLWGWIKDKTNKLKKGLKRFAPFIAVGLLASPMLSHGGKMSKDDNNDNKNKIENIITSQNDKDDIVFGGTLREVVVTGVDRSKVNTGMVVQYAKRIGHQEKLSPEDATKRAIEDLKAFKNLPSEIKSKFSGQSDEEKLAKLGVVRGDQNKLHTPIDSLLKGEKINPLTLKDISERTFHVTEDFGAHKDNNLKNGKQTIDMSAYLVKKTLEEKGIKSK